MATSLAQLTISAGQTAPQVAWTAGSDLTGTDVMRLQIDQTAMTKGQALILLEQMVRKIEESAWPPITPA